MRVCAAAMTLAWAHALQLPGIPSSIAAQRGAVGMALADGVLNVGVIGAGRIGLVHLEALSSCETANPVIISNPTIAKAKAAAEKYKLPKFSSGAGTRRTACGCARVAASPDPVSVSQMPWM